MKKLLSLFLILALLLGVMPALGEALPAEEAEASAVGLPAVGDVVEGFEVKEIREFGLIGASLVYFEHQRTGAKFLYVANDDTNRAFQLSFPTRMTDDKGVPHVLEHGTLSGSTKYPSASLWFNVVRQTYNTYMNAFTTDAMTGYPMASLSEEQLLKLADMYTHMCFNPLLMTDESIFRTEAWRYEMADADADMVYNGTVYSEMLGAQTLNYATLMAANKATFPGASVSYSYGGDPDQIPEMTWEDVKDYHEKYYHPSNCLALLYGSIKDYTAFLKLLDEAFAPFEKKEISFDEPDYAPITEPVISSFEYPVAEGTSTENQAIIIYYILCPGMKGDIEQETLIDHACNLLSDSASPVMQALRKAFPTGSFSLGREIAAPDDAICIMAPGLNDGDADLFRETVDTALAEIAQTGFAPELVDNIATALIFNAKLASENSSPVETIIYRLTYHYAVTGDIFRYVEDYEALDDIEQENKDGRLAAAVGQWLVDPALFTVTTGMPVPGQKEIHDAEIASHLAEIKAAMSEEEKQAVIDATNAAPVEEDNSAMLADLTAVTVATLPEEIKEYEIRDEIGEDGVRRIEAVTAVDGISYIMLNLDAAALPQEDIHYVRLYTRLLGSMDTDQHTWEELDPLVTRYLYGHTFGVLVSEYKTEYHPYMAAEWYSLDDDLEAGYNLAEEILFHTQFTDTQTLLERIQAQKTATRSRINSEAYVVLLYRQLGISSPFARYYEYLNYMEYYAFLEELEQTVQEHPEEVVARLEAVRDFFANRSGAVVGTAGTEASLALNRPLADAFLAKLDDIAREPVAYDLPEAAKKEGLIVDSNIQYNMIAVPWKAIDPEVNGDACQSLGELVSDQLLHPVLRDQMGAYGAYCASTANELYMFTYRDPNVAETFAYLDTLPDAINALTLTQEDVDRYIISTYSSLAQPEGEMTGAISAINARISGKPDDRKLQAMRALKTATPETLKAFAGNIADLLNTGIRGTAGSAAAINANAEMYDVVLNPFNVQEVTTDGFEDVPEDHPLYAYVTDAVSQGLMLPLDDTRFGIDEPATIGDYLGGIYVLVGGPNADARACLELLAANGLIDPATDLSAPLTEQFACDLLTTLGAEYSTDTPDKVMTRGELAELFMAE